MDKSNIIKRLLERGILVSPDFLEQGDNFDVDSFCDNVGSRGTVLVERGDRLGHGIEKDETAIAISDSKINENNKYNINVIFSYDKEVKKREVGDFVAYFKNRYEILRKILASRQELQESISILRISRKQPHDRISIIGLVLDKTETKNGNIRLTIEDTTGVCDVLVTKNKEDLYKAAKDIVLDEVIGISGTVSDRILFCNQIYFPDVPVTHELKKAPDEVYAVFISDIHFGIKNFLSTDFLKFVKWLRGEYGSDNQKAVANKVGYLFITGDVVEGAGIYPGQEEDLEIKDIKEQYNEAYKYLSMIPKRIKIIICGGNHDAMRISEPQPPFDKVISKKLYEIPNMVVVSNPAVINIHSSEEFPGFNVLMYHGFSFPYYGDNVPSITEKGGIFRCDLIMKFLLQKRHLAPSHSSTLYVPDGEFDPLVIRDIPDIFVSGHIHQIAANNYRNVSMINSSCWVVQSEDNARRGIVPQPCKIPIINLKTREIKIMNFLDENTKVLLSERMGLK